MTDYRRIIDDVQSVIYSSELVDADIIAPLADEYREGCIELNDRLRKVGRLLLKGLRSEAIHHADVEPKLLESVAVMDFPELPQWLELLRALELAPPPVLLIDNATELNQAYAEQKPLVGLLGTHRLLALARAPIAARIHTLRQIAKYDHKNPVWQDDLAEYEAVRLKEMQREFEVVFKRQDLSAANELSKQLKETDWIVQPPRQLNEYVDKNLKRLLAEKSREKLKAVADRLRAAMEDLDIELTKSLLRHWDQMMAHAQPSVHDPVVQSVTPVIAWVNEEEAERVRREEEAFRQQEVEEKMADFKHAVKEGMPLEVIEEQRAAIVEEDVQIPKYLQRHYESRLTEDRRRKQNTWIGLCGILVVLLIAVGLAIWYFLVR